MKLMRGMFHPPEYANPQLQVEHRFVRGDDRPSDYEWALQQIRQHGRTPLLTVEPWAGVAGLLTWLPTAQGEIYLRLMHEFNGTWYPWAGTPQAFKATWRTVARLAPANVKLVWCPNIDFKGARPLEDFYPGERFVDVFGVDGYDQIGGAPPMSWYDLFAPTMARLRALDAKTIMICETATPRSPHQEGWVKDMLAHAIARGDVEGVCWFNADRADGAWQMNALALATFAQGGGA